MDDDNKKVIKTKEDRIKESEFNNIDILFEDYEEFDTPKIATIEYYNGSVVYEDYSKLDSYLKEVFIPKRIKKIMKKNKYNEDESYYSISLHRVLELNLSHKELLYVFKYLKNEGIAIRGYSSLIGNEIENYEYVKTQKYNCHGIKYEKDNEELIKLFELYRNTNDKKVREKIIMNNVLLVKYIASKYSAKYKININELESYGYESLCKAVDKYDYTKGFSFSSYAFPVIQSGIKNGIAEIWNKTSNSTFYSYYYKVSSYIYRVEKMENKKITEDYSLVDKVVDLLIKDGKIKDNQKEFIKNYIYSHFALSLDTDNINILSDGDFDYVNNDIYDKQLKDYIDVVLSEVLNDRQKEVIKKRFGLDGEIIKTLEQIGKEMGITRERARQLEERALEKLSSEKIKKKLLSFLKDTCDSMNYVELFGYTNEDNYLNDIYNDNYDYKKPPRR